MRVGIYVGAAGTQTGGMHAFVRAVLAGVDEIQTSHSLQVIHSGLSPIFMKSARGCREKINKEDNKMVDPNSEMKPVE